MENYDWTVFHAEMHSFHERMRLIRVYLDKIKVN